jgi:hypothetical protein
MDIVTVATGASVNSVKLWKNLGAGNFSATFNMTGTLVNARAAQIVDLDR